MRHFKKHKIVMLPTNKPLVELKVGDIVGYQRIEKINGENVIDSINLVKHDYDYRKELDDTLGYQKQHYHLYVLSDEEIKINDWVLGDGYKNVNPSFMLIEKVDAEMLTDDINITNGYHCHKIIASTYTDLGLPNLPHSFLQLYCELNGMDQINVEYEDIFDRPLSGVYNQKTLKIDKQTNSISIESIE